MPVFYLLSSYYVPSAQYVYLGAVHEHNNHKTHLQKEQRRLFDRQKRQEGEIYTDKEWEKAQSSSRESRGEASKPTLTFNSIYWTLLCIGLSAKHFTNSAASNSQNQPVK